MTEFDDPGADTARSLSRAALLGFSVIAERMGRLRAQQADAARAADERRAQDLERTWIAQRDAAKAQLSVATDRWAQTADPVDVAHAWSTAAAWSTAEPEIFADDARRMHRVLVERFGVDPSVTDTEALIVQARAAADRKRAAADSSTALARTDESVAAVAAGAGLSADADEAREDAARERGAAAAADHAASSLDAEADTAGRSARIVERAKAAGVETEVAAGAGRAADGNVKPVAAASQQKEAVGRAAARQRRGVQRTEQLGR